ncbi:phosphatase PAP2 family protein [Clostridium sp. AM58-1XD]|uniref:phosphatase PAP2 family protein n=1 Tax=Clostridium sp. AM58-1XD TaxID=2292307 RepID=UPI001FA8C7D1|nr:phosphatase PAP2 family protein [Clostridium sp. AM58-1XD]
MDTQIELASNLSQQKERNVYYAKEIKEMYHYNWNSVSNFYAIVILFYVFFEFVIINYRPVILSHSLEASFPSSHTVIVICIMVTAMLQFHYLRDKKVCLWTIDIASVLIIVVTVVGRLISGVHWFTDIVAGILLSSALVTLYYSILKYIEEKKG